MTEDTAESERKRLPTVLLDLPSAQQLAGHFATHRDLLFVRECCGRLLQLLDSTEGEPDSVFVEALWTAALVGYSRCFKDGKREYRLQTRDIAALPLEGEVVEFHQLMLDLRDKHIAHSVNPFEQIVVGAMLSPLDAPNRQVEGISTLMGRLVVVDRNAVWQLGNLAHAMATAVAEKVEKQTAIVLAETQALDIDALYRLPEARIVAPGADAVAKPRSWPSDQSPRA
jgi:hypothetical protein